MPRRATVVSAIALLLLYSSAACAADVPAPPAEPGSSPWSGSGELGFASSRGNSSNESFNGRFKGQYLDGDWIHSIDLFALRASAEYTNTNDDGSTERVHQTTSNRYTGSAGSALQLGEHRQLTASLRYERDDFATYDRLATIGIGYGTRIMDGERRSIDVQIGPGVRRAHDVAEDRTETGLIGRGLVDFKYGLTANTELANTLLIESGSYNTFAQNDLGISVSMNSRLALKAGWQARHNSDVSDDKKKTDTLTTMNVVYKFK
ncbi:DUF481 domain-containing protein [Xanthomonas hyacinthi]|uniref:DUF481 domain-containing protein n=1 Tax=Xanthomonas hyacinthi TaxID=56455 RepID=A0A2S7EWV6_9XANT|nr:DUF481 domain-containing protein [Xanthomonas hyacinthi]KLD76546.1 membrane protein [Xanthomonas hyacinthi DSM 19077]PPU97502.1 DUF481 domain-containing protein [Xanthomonas hyacinthi]QGY77304.1 DUF481 domain-containing protein [Xanthomonas hyacinthi]